MKLDVEFDETTEADMGCDVKNNHVPWGLKRVILCGRRGDPHIL